MNTSSIRRKFSCALLALSLVAPGGPAVAQPASPQDEVKAQQLANEANEQLEKRNYQRAFELFSEADRLYPAPTLKVAMARARIGQGRLLEAQRILLQAAAQPPRPGDKPHWAKVRRDAAVEAASLTPRLAAIEVSTKPLPDGKTPTITIDGEPLAPSQLSTARVVDPGEHRVVATADGYRTFEQTFTLAEGEKKRVLVALEPSEAPPAAPPTPPPSAPPPRVAPTSPASTSPPPRPAPTPTFAPTTPAATRSDKGMRWTTPVGLGAAGLFGAVGTVTGILALSKVGKLKDDCPTERTCPPSSQSDIDSARTMGTVSTVSFALAGGGVALFVLGLASGGGRSQTGSAGSLQLGFGPGSASLGGRF